MSKRFVCVILIGAVGIAAATTAIKLQGTQRICMVGPGAADWRTWLLMALTLALLVALSACRHSRERLSVELHRLRNRIAADLHDDVGSSLSQIAIMSEVASQGDGPQSAALEEIAGVARQVLESLSEVVWALEPSHDRLHDLTERMRWFAGEALSAQRTSLDFRVSGPQCERGLSTDVRRQIFLIFKECMNNIARHAGAAHATVVLGEERNMLILHVEDDGRGFDSNHETLGHGLNNMRRRALLMGGELKTRSQIGRGTSLDLRIPIAPLRRRVQPELRIPHEYAGKKRA